MKVIALSFASLLLTMINVPNTSGEECVSVKAETGIQDSRQVIVHVSDNDCAEIYGFYLQIERKGSIQVTDSPTGWTYGGSEDFVFWTTGTEPIDSNVKVFGIKVHGNRPYMLHWIALNHDLSPVAEGTLIGQ